MGFKLVWDVPFHFDPFWIWPFEQLPQLASLKEPRYSRVPVFPWSTFALFLRADETSLSCFFAQPAGVCQFKRTVAVTTRKPSCLKSCGSYKICRIDLELKLMALMLHAVDSSNTLGRSRKHLSLLRRLCI